MKNAKAGQVTLPRATRPASSTARSARRSFEAKPLKENLLALIDDLNKAKPATSKGVYLQEDLGVLDDGPGRRRGPRVARAV